MSELYNIDNQLNEILSPTGWHGARIKLFSRLICALIKLQTISYIKLSEGLGGKAKIESNLRRIQRFFAEFDLNLDVISTLLLNSFLCRSLIPCQWTEPTGSSETRISISLR